MAKVASTLWSKLAEVASLVATPLTPSHYIQLFRPLAVSHTRQARVEAVRDEVPGVRTLILRPSRGWRTHKPGQHVRVGVAIAGRVTTRTYSISSSPDRRDGCFEITVKAQGRVSNALVYATPVGTFLAIGEATGEFVMPEGAPVRALFITAGSGITPVAAMVRALASRGAMPDVVHVHFSRTPGEHIFGRELDAISDRHPSYRRVTIHTSEDPRRFSAARLADCVPDWREREAWACGPRGLLDAITADFARAGRAHALHVERFRAVLAVVPANASGGRVTFTTSGPAGRAIETLADASTSILRVAEDAGLAPAHGCRMGICHTCDATLLSGCVRDLRTGTTIDEPGARVQICVCAAAGDVELAV
ncbi:NADPH oxidoreductase [soil metagenome]